MSDGILPVGFRAEVLQQVVRLLRSGESCALVGVGSSGKSNIARHLARPDVVQEYFGAEAAATLPVYLNCKPFAHRAPAEFYLHILDQLARAAQRDGLSDAVRVLPTDLEALWQAAHTYAGQLSRRNLDQAVGRLAQAGARRVIFILDDCDDLITHTAPVLFSDLRGLRDNFKQLLVYLTLTRREPTFLRDNTPEFEEVFELISAPGHTLAIGPYVESDGLLMLRRLAGRQAPPRTLTELEARQLYHLSGGHAGLLRSLFFATQYNAELAAASLSNTDWPRLAEHADVEGEARKIWDSLEPDEQADLRQLLLGLSPSPEGLRRLERRGLVEARFDHPPRLFSPIWEHCLQAILELQSVRPDSEPELEFTGVGRQVRVAGSLVTDLLSPEFAILRCLHASLPEPCSRATLVEAMRVAEQDERGGQARGDPLRRLDAYVRQMRAKLGPAGYRVQPAGDGFRWV
jgi:hypothetical protein